MKDSSARFFEASFKDIEIATDTLIVFLKDAITDIIDLTSLKLEDGSFVDEKLSKYYSDILFSVKLKNGNSQAVDF